MVFDGILGDSRDGRVHWSRRRVSARPRASSYLACGESAC
jgi:hypothetical protein